MEESCNLRRRYIFDVLTDKKLEVFALSLKLSVGVAENVEVEENRAWLEDRGAVQVCGREEMEVEEVQEMKEEDEEGIALTAN